MCVSTCVQIWGCTCLVFLSHSLSLSLCLPPCAHICIYIFKGCRPVPPTPPLGASPGFFLFWQRLLAGSGLLACWLARSLACLLVFSAFPGRARLPTASTNQRSAIWKVDSNRSPGRNQQEQLRVQRAWRPHSLRRSEHEPKECAGSLLRRGRVPNVAFESNMQQGYRSV